MGVSTQETLLFLWRFLTYLSIVWWSKTLHVCVELALGRLFIFASHIVLIYDNGDPFGIISTKTRQTAFNIKFPVIIQLTQYLR